MAKQKTPSVSSEPKVSKSERTLRNKINRVISQNLPKYNKKEDGTIDRSKPIERSEEDSKKEAIKYIEKSKVLGKEALEEYRKSQSKKKRKKSAPGRKKKNEIEEQLS
jgi:hypothetical protein